MKVQILFFVLCLTYANIRIRSSQEEMNDIIKIIIEYRLHVAFSIDKIEQIYELNQLFTYQYENLKL